MVSFFLMKYNSILNVKIANYKDIGIFKFIINTASITNENQFIYILK